MSVEKLIGSWKLKSKIGSGGNGEVGMHRPNRKCICYENPN